MDNHKVKNCLLRKKRQARVRKNLCGTAERPRMSVLKTNQHIHIQLIDDQKGHTLASLSTMSKELSADHRKKCKETGKALGQKIAQKALEQQIKAVVFDRGPHRYHGVVAAVADGARDAGLEL
ncbi:MAG: 50S ribosomal protein L18 [Verrucomicrobia bacterium]|nr:50S ribosomal protein L18 [Verrucomicrobiota bacterium]MBS0647162.1 50S ribosomal protein L18 [Verrucomicrobiota bacterium]